MIYKPKMWLHVLFLAIVVQGLSCMQVVVDFNQVILETADAIVDITDRSRSHVGSLTGANDVGASGGSFSTQTETGNSHHGSRGHRRNATTNQARIGKTGDIRCFCNMPQCVATSYMCKAADSQGGCFSDLTDVVDIHRARHGCVDLLPRARQSECRATRSAVTAPGVSSMLLCCQRDMCNHIDSPEMRQLLNATFLGGSPSFLSFCVRISVGKKFPLRRVLLTLAIFPACAIPTNGRVYFGNDVWLKAATIAVPICGGFILVLLIILAVKILRKDSKRQSGPMMHRGAYVQCQNGPMRGQPSKMRLLLEESSPQSYDKNMAHARLNFNPCSANLAGKQSNVFPAVHGSINPSDPEEPLCNKNIIKWANNNHDMQSASPV
ncbi:hypothetical protein B566_EDAN002181 [Ephemera danica]|nr:hypothetical protein B566_EDAN002181 [Ephemera danica]